MHGALKSGRDTSRPYNTHSITYNPDIHRQRSIRLKVFDYSQAGAYFVTMCRTRRGEAAPRPGIEGRPSGPPLQRFIQPANLTHDSIHNVPRYLYRIIPVIEPA